MSSEERIIFFDLETTGLNLYRDKIIEIAAIDNKDNQFHSLINPQVKLSPYITTLTSITDDMLKEAPTLEEKKQQIIEFFDLQNENQWIISHNNDNFDIIIFMNNLNIKREDIKSKILCNYKLSNKMSLTRNNRLITLAQYFKISNEQTHRAFDDAILVKLIFKKLKEILGVKLSITNISMDDVFNYIYNN